jgi:hypothetical protein
MAKEYKVKQVENEVATVEAIVDEKVEAQTQPAPTPKKGFSAPSIPTDKIFKMVTDRQMREQMWRDETMEPHVHMIKLLFLVLILAIIISVLGSMFGF